MEGGVAGTGRADLQDSLPRPGVGVSARSGAASHYTAAAELVEDQIAGSLLDLANPEVGRVLEGLEQTRLTLDPAILEGLLRTATDAAFAHDTSAAMKAITELVTRDPERGAQLVRQADWPLAIRSEANDLLQKLAESAKSHAEHALAQASIVVENTRGSGTTTELLAIAQRFMDTGQHINFVRAEEIAQAILAYMPADQTTGAARSRVKEGSVQRTAFLGVWAWAAIGLLLLAAFAWLVLNRG